MQTYFVPLPEADIFSSTFKVINTGARAPIMSITAIAISIDDSIVWYDHWEDGYDADTVTRRASTRVWGDGNASNGCAPGVSPCNNSNDRLKAGQSIILENWVDLPRNKNVIRFDAGDRIQSSYPIAVTRAEYPKTPGSLLAGAVEVLPIEKWGRDFIVPAGQDIRENKYSQAFEYTGVYVMAGSDDTIITLPDGSTTFLDRGESHQMRIPVKGARIKADKDVQVHLLAGDVASTYEMRWYSLLSEDKWSKEYISPVGDTTGQTRVVVFNAGTSTISVDYQYFSGTSLRKRSMSVAPKNVQQSEIIPTGSGARFNSTSNFIALSMTDTQSNSGSTSGMIYDWGFPLVPRNQLSSQVLIGWGYGCTGNSCGGGSSRSVVWITPVEDADLYIDYNNDGRSDQTISAKYLSSNRIMDNTDHDMTGAIIWATARNTGPLGRPVEIAAAWGQDGSRSYSGDNSALDLGTVVVPFYTVRVQHFVELDDDKNNDGVVNPGDTLLYTIRVQNLGQDDVQINDLDITNNGVPILTTYIEDSVWYYPDGGLAPIKIPDNTQGTPNPLDSTGIPNPVKLTKRGGTHDIIFKVVTQGTEDRIIYNDGTILQAHERPDLPFDVDIPLVVPAGQPKVTNDDDPDVCIPLEARRERRNRRRRHLLAQEEAFESPTSPFT
jgi:uncharacterized repeat protein (TIGR01451 family)